MTGEGRAPAWEVSQAGEGSQGPPPWPSGAPRARSQLPPWAFRGRKAKEEKLFPFPDQSKHRPPLPAPAHARAPTLFSPKRLPAAPVHAHPAPYFSQGSQ